MLGRAAPPHQGPIYRVPPPGTAYTRNNRDLV